MTKPPLNPVARLLDDALHLAHDGAVINPVVLEAQIRRAIITEKITPPEQRKPDDRTTIEREVVLAAVELLGFDSKQVIDVEMNPTHVNARLILRAGGLPMSHTLRIGPARTRPRRATIADPLPGAVVSPEEF